MVWSPRVCSREPVDVCTLVGEVVAHVRRSEKSEREITLKLDVSRYEVACK